MHKVLFCFYTNDHEYNMGIGFIASALKQHGVDVDLVIFRQTEKELNTPEEIVSRILERNPTIVAFSVMSFNWQHIKRVISILRPRYDGLIIIGGYHAILLPFEVISFLGVDAICLGEGEQPMIDLVTLYDPRRRGNIPVINGFLFKGEALSKDSFKKKWLAENLEDYPYMDYELFDLEDNVRLSQKILGFLSPAGIFSLPVITGRGCPHRCTYCSNSVLINYYGGLNKFLRKYRPNLAVTNINALIKRYRPQFLEFFDETFTLNKKWVREFCSIYKKEIGLPFSIMSRIDSIDEHTVSVLAESGLKLVFFGLESGDEVYRIHYLKRKMTDKAIKEGARLLKRYGIMIITFNMFGMPFETKEMINKTFTLNAEIEPDAAMAFIYQPLPGTELARLAYESNMVLPPPKDMWDLYSQALDTPELPASYVTEMFSRFRERFANQRIIQDIYTGLQKLLI